MKTKVKEDILKAARKKPPQKQPFKGEIIRLTNDYLIVETMETRRH